MLEHLLGAGRRCSGLGPYDVGTEVGTRVSDKIWGAGASREAEACRCDSRRSVCTVLQKKPAPRGRDYTGVNQAVFGLGKSN